MYKTHTQCRACGYAQPGTPGTKSGEPDRLIPVFGLGVQPLANDFRKSGELHAGFAPLQVLFCPRCTLAQLSVTVRPDILYSNYSYVTSPSSTMLNHFGKLTHDLCDEMGHGLKGTKVLEIGSNDGRFLHLIKKGGAASCVGMDPAANLWQESNKDGVSPLVGFFSSVTAKVIEECYGSRNLIVARHVFCHVDDWKDFALGLEMLAEKDTVIAIETPYVMDLLEGVEFDTIYHEHLSYLSIRSVVYLLEKTNLHLHRIIRYPIHG
jgi:novobiocin biosynthesis protein NovU/D-mycarose 3-C-methyltransferase